MRLWGRPRRSASRERAHQNAEIEAGDVDQIAFGDVLTAPKPGPAHAAAIERVSEAAFDQFAALAHFRAPDARFQCQP